MKRNILSIAIAGALLLSSCSTSKSTLPYFTDISTVETGVVEAGNYLSTIQPDDELLITVHTYDPTASAPFNMPVVNPGNGMLQPTSTVPLPTLATGTQLQT
ncbi:MAG: hypothetical protein K2M12_00565, partial [Muribaculaceae bacterium]|nr:hypothetical protein [Muribaculaceae bacterium]